MGKRYFCDYCDRSFQDNLHNRKKHLNGLQHLKAKKSWYDMFRDAAAILLDEQNKRPCRKFLLTGQCDFGPNCRFSHMSERDLQELSIQVEEERRAREWPPDIAELPEGHLEDWLEKRAKRLSSAPSSRAGSPTVVIESPLLCTLWSPARAWGTGGCLAHWSLPNPRALTL
ncbi:zinc finger matrin-type protein 5 isoform X3 [Rousettus aegyptiacus]|uniref:zinc finger matrin-type protein 5 isoform X3 n=1 Tax=Rousettus aegyptiacus TaxID=9407 RepID=UPI00168CEAE5|nr:zinc finger matrin-type protein 5 isoform X3 [Rousettus aegyptiacus]